MKAKLLRKIRKEFYLKKLGVRYVAVHKKYVESYFEYYSFSFLIHKILEYIGFGSYSINRIYDKSARNKSVRKKYYSFRVEKRELLLKEINNESLQN